MLPAVVNVTIVMDPIISVVFTCADDVHLLLDVARQNGKCVFFTPHAADTILACVFHSADDVCTCPLFSLYKSWTLTLIHFFLCATFCSVLYMHYINSFCCEFYVDVIMYWVQEYFFIWKSLFHHRISYFVSIVIVIGHCYQYFLFISHKSP